MSDLRPDHEYQAFLAQGRFMIQRSKRTGAFFFYPRVAEPGTGSEALEWVEASGAGTVYSTTIVRAKPPAADQNVVLVDLAEGPRLMSRVVGIPPALVTIGMKVRARIEAIDGTAAVVFLPAEGPGS
jgi:uncharacterized OB-fold protein